MRKRHYLIIVMLLALSACSGGSGSLPGSAVPASPNGPTQSLSSLGGGSELALDASVVSPPASHIYVADGASVKVFSLAGSGNIAPARVLSGSATGLTNVQDIAVDVKGNLYVANADSSTSGSVRVFAHGASGNVAPFQVIAGPQSGIQSIGAVAVSPYGYIFVGEYTNSFPPVRGNLLRFLPLSSGAGAPAETLATSIVRHLALDSTGSNVIVSDMPNEPTNESRNIFTFARDFAVRPGTLFDVHGTGGQAIADDVTTHSYYVFLNNDVVRYAENATGDFGSNGGPPPPTPLSDLVLSACDTVPGLAVDAAQEIVASHWAGGGCTQPAISIFPPRANGHVAPMRTIAGSATMLKTPGSIALGI